MDLRTRTVGGDGDVSDISEMARDAAASSTPRGELFSGSPPARLPSPYNDYRMPAPSSILKMLLKVVPSTPPEAIEAVWLNVLEWGRALSTSSLPPYFSPSPSLPSFSAIGALSLQRNFCRRQRRKSYVSYVLEKPPPNDTCSWTHVLCVSCAVHM